MRDTFDKYPADSLELPTQALLTIWDCLSDFRDDLVLVGELAVRFLTRPPVEGLPGAVTLDVDFGVSLAADRGGGYPGIRESLSGHGFQWDKGRFTRKFPKLNAFGGPSGRKAPKDAHDIQLGLRTGSPRKGRQ